MKFLGLFSMRLPNKFSGYFKNILFLGKTLLSEFYINDIRMSDEFMVVPNLSEEAIIGATTMQKWRIKLDFEHDKAHVDPKMARLQLKKSALDLV